MARKKKVVEVIEAPSDPDSDSESLPDIEPIRTPSSNTFWSASTFYDTNASSSLTASSTPYLTTSNPSTFTASLSKSFVRNTGSFERIGDSSTAGKLAKKDAASAMRNNQNGASKTSKSSDDEDEHLASTSSTTSNNRKKTGKGTRTGSKERSRPTTKMSSCPAARRRFSPMQDSDDSDESNEQEDEEEYGDKDDDDDILEVDLNDEEEDRKKPRGRGRPKKEKIAVAAGKGAKGRSNQKVTGALKRAKPQNEKNAKKRVCKLADKKQQEAPATPSSRDSSEERNSSLDVSTALVHSISKATYSPEEEVITEPIKAKMPKLFEAATYRGAQADKSTLNERKGKKGPKK